MLPNILQFQKQQQEHFYLLQKLKHDQTICITHL